MRQEQALFFAVCVSSANLTYYLRSIVMEAYPEILERNPGCHSRYAHTKISEAAVLIAESLYSYNTFLVFIALYASYFLKLICIHIGNMLIAPVPLP